MVCPSGLQVAVQAMPTRQALLVMVWCCLAISGGRAAEATDGTLPNFSLPLIHTAGQSIDRSTLRGKVTYVDFWASWCIPCRASFPWLDTMYQKYRERGFQVIGINKDQEPAEMERFIQRYPVSFRLATDPGDALAKHLRVMAMPTGFLVDRQGVIRSVHRGFRAEDAATREAEILSLLERP